jgi:hypothetical protein
MTNKQWTESDYRLKTLLTIAPSLFFLIIAGIICIKSCIGRGIDPMDDSIIKSRQVLEHLNVIDSTQNGFRVVYATKENVTDARLEEIRNRKHIKNAFERLQSDAPVYFGGSLFDTNIYDFADFAIRYDADPDIEMHNIFVTGYKKSRLYIGKNPMIEKSAEFFNDATEQLGLRVVEDPTRSPCCTKLRESMHRIL